MLNDAKYDVYYIVRNAGTLVSNLSDYPSGYKTCLNILAISNLVEADKRDKILSGVVLQFVLIVYNIKGNYIFTSMCIQCEHYSLKMLPTEL